MMPRLFAALYVSEAWYDRWTKSGDLYAKARAVVLFDRVLTARFEQIENTPPKQG